MFSPFSGTLFLEPFFWLVSSQAQTGEALFLQVRCHGDAKDTLSGPWSLPITIVLKGLVLACACA